MSRWTPKNMQFGRAHQTVSPFDMSLLGCCGQFCRSRKGGKYGGGRDTLDCTTDPAAGSHTVKSSVIRLLAALDCFSGSTFRTAQTTSSSSSSSSCLLSTLANSDKTKLSNSKQAILVCVFVCRHCQYSFRSKKFLHMHTNIYESTNYLPKHWPFTARINESTPPHEPLIFYEWSGGQTTPHLPISSLVTS